MGRASGPVAAARRAIDADHADDEFDLQDVADQPGSEAPAVGATTRRQLADAAARRTLDAEHRVRKALRELDREGAAISFAAVATQRQRKELADVREELAIPPGRVREIELDRRARCA